MKFSKTELQHLFRAWLIVSLAFAFVISGTYLMNGNFLQSLASVQFLQAAIISFVTVGTGFLLHELAHKFLAQRYGCIAEFRAFDSMLRFALLISATVGFIFAAPGAVFIHGNVNNARNGRISAAGPLVNIALAFLFFIFLVFFAVSSVEHPLLTAVARYGLMINGWLALFNLLPFWQMDGMKVLRWNRKIYALMVAAAVVAMMLPGLVA